jgi:hypothetical protein
MILSINPSHLKILAYLLVMSSAHQWSIACKLSKMDKEKEASGDPTGRLLMWMKKCGFIFRDGFIGLGYAIKGQNLCQKADF